MTYCRFSDNDHQCDVYVYESCYGGYTIHVGCNRVVFKSKLPETVSLDNMDAYFKRHKIVMEMIQDAERVKIGLEHDGKSFNEDTAIDCANRLIELKNMGYNVPQYAIDGLMEDGND